MLYITQVIQAYIPIMFLIEKWELCVFLGHLNLRFTTKPNTHKIVQVGCAYKHISVLNISKKDMIHSLEKGSLLVAAMT